MEQSPKTTGRMELAQRYFPNILPHSAWKKFKSLLEEEPSRRSAASPPSAAAPTPLPK